ncbi:hypothetical protein WG908_16205 [Sphingobium sp. AN641]|uniref:hypothetical protein n=1 Tax=Sphingobium sp. AN641 TaxID=3133443 RepID=UPI0030BB417F
MPLIFEERRNGIAWSRVWGDGESKAQKESIGLLGRSAVNWLMPFSTTELLTIVGGSSVIAAAVTQGIGIIRDWRKAKHEGKFSALYVAIALESYADKCATLIGDSQNHQNSDGHAGVPHGNIADLPDYPAAVEWKPFGIRDTTRAMSFRVEVDTRKASFSGEWEFGDEEDIVPLVREESARLGLKALELAIGFRNTWGIEAVDYSTEWNVRDYLKTALAEHVTKREAYEKIQRDSHDQLMGSLNETPALPSE